MARRRKSLGLNNKLLFELAVGIVALLLIFGVLNSVTHTTKTQLVTTEDLLNNSYIRLEWRNSTDPTADVQFPIYRLSDVATYYDGYLYISLVPPDSEHTVLRGFSIYYLGNYTVSDLVDRGFNNIELELEPINSTALVYHNTFNAGELSFRANTVSNSYIWSDDYVLVSLTKRIGSSDPADVKYNATFGKFNESIDVGSLLVSATASDALDKKTGIHVWIGDVENLEGLKLKLNMYVASEKPLLKAFTEPVWAFIAGLWSTLLAIYNRVRQYIASFVGGFSVSALFTGLIGDPVTALLISAAAIAVFFFALARPAPRRR